MNDKEIRQKLVRLSKQEKYRKQNRTIRNRRLITFQGMKYVQYEVMNDTTKKYHTKLRKFRKGESISKFDTSNIQEIV